MEDATKKNYGSFEPETVVKTISFKIVIDEEQTEKFYTFDASELLDIGNYLAKPKSITINSTIYNEERCQDLKVGYTNCPIPDGQCKYSSIQDFPFVKGGKEKVLDIEIPIANFVWFQKETKNCKILPHVYYRPTDKYNIISSDITPLKEVFVRMGNIPSVSLGTVMFKIKRLYLGVVTIYTEASFTFEKVKI